MSYSLSLMFLSNDLLGLELSIQYDSMIVFLRECTLDRSVIVRGVRCCCVVLGAWCGCFWTISSPSRVAEMIF